MKIFNIFFILLFVYSAIVQYNDPDPYLWMPIYLYGAILCSFALVKKFNWWLYGAGLSSYLIYAAVLFFSDTGVLCWINEHNAESLTQAMQAQQPWIEETREFFGLVLLIVALSVNLLYSYRLKRKTIQARTIKL